METSSEEQVSSGLSHLGILMPLYGLVLPVIIWVTQKEKSRFVAAQALQAIAYQIGVMVLWLMMVIPWMAFVIAMVVVSATSGHLAEHPPAAFFVGYFGFIAFALLFWLVVLIYGFYGAYSAFKGRDFRYVIVGGWVKRRMEG